MLSGRSGYVPILRTLRKHLRYLQVYVMACALDVDILMVYLRWSWDYISQFCIVQSFVIN